MNISRHTSAHVPTRKWVMSLIKISHVIWSIHFIWTSHVTRMNKSCQIYGWVMSHTHKHVKVCICCRHATRIHELLDMWCMSYSTCRAWFTSHMMYELLHTRCMSSSTCHVRVTPHMMYELLHMSCMSYFTYDVWVTSHMIYTYIYVYIYVYIGVCNKRQRAIASAGRCSSSKTRVDWKRRDTTKWNS